MQTYVIFRRGAWLSQEDLDAATAVASRIAEDEMSGQLNWIRSYVLSEEDGTLGTVCVYEADDEDVIMEHAQRAEIPADEVMLVEDTVIMRDDP